MNVEELINKLMRIEDKSLPVVNSARKCEEVEDVDVESVDYCTEEIVTKTVVSIW